MLKEDVFNGYGVEVSLTNPDDFLIIRETLTRIGIQSHKEKKLVQSCNILHKRGRYAIMHFKEMFGIDGKKTDLTDDDLMRRNTVVKLVSEWGLCEILDEEKVKDSLELSKVKIVPYEEKHEWNLVPKYHFGSKKK